MIERKTKENVLFWLTNRRKRFHFLVQLWVIWLPSLLKNNKLKKFESHFYCTNRQYGHKRIEENTLCTIRSEICDFGWLVAWISIHSSSNDCKFCEVIAINRRKKLMVHDRDWDWKGGVSSFHNRRQEPFLLFFY